ncbi:MAG: hypothetical protein NEHIOOID_00645 [Holosporales bacterium]
MKEITMKQKFYRSQGLLVLLMTYSLEGSTLRTSSSWDACDRHMPTISNDQPMQQMQERLLHDEPRHAIVSVKDDTDFTRDSAFKFPEAIPSTEHRQQCAFIRGARRNTPSQVTPPPLARMAESSDNNKILIDEELWVIEKPKTLVRVILNFLGSAFGDNPPPDTAEEHARF